jgi:hypothetical protein
MRLVARAALFVLPVLTLSCQGELHEQPSYSVQLDADLSDPAKDSRDKLKMLMTDLQGLREVEAWISRYYRYIDGTTLPYAIMPKGVLFVSGPGDLQFEATPIRNYELYITYKNLKGVEENEFASLLGIFRKYGRPHAGAFKYAYLWDVKSLEYQVWCPTCMKYLQAPTTEEAEAESLGKAHENETGHPTKIRVRNLPEPIFNKY